MLVQIESGAHTKPNKTMKSKQILILKGVSGSGKSSLANLLCSQRVGWTICEADLFFYDKQGNYNFDPAKLGSAHKFCQNQFVDYLNEPSVETIIVSNTNCDPKDMKFYEDQAAKRNIRVTYLVIERRHNNVNSHGVPEATLDRQEQKLRNSLKLR
jgi:predicted ABC-type ATPase